MFVVPIHVSWKNYATLCDFIDNASEIQQHEFWKKVAELATELIKEKGKVGKSMEKYG